MKGREADPRQVYADIMDLPHWDSPSRPRMSARARAAQFAPYAALVGYGDMVREEARETDLWKDLGEDETEELNARLAEVDRLLAEGVHPVCEVSFFQPDAKKQGGAFGSVTGKVKRIDPVRRKLVLFGRKGPGDSAEEIDLDRVIRLLPGDETDL